MTVCTSVVFPTPLRPRTASTWPSWTARCTPSRTRVPGYPPARSSIANKLIGASFHRSRGGCDRTALSSLVPRVDAQVGPLHELGTSDLSGSSAGDDGPQVHDRHLVGQGEHDVEIVLDEKHRDVLRQRP